MTRALGKLGFKLERIHGSHLIFRHSDGRITVVPAMAIRRSGEVSCVR
ncbi:MAG: type II toxin-antitoxin system HicA family toxin [Nitrososphaerales archaeon]